jgi:hypothetical protein
MNPGKANYRGGFIDGARFSCDKAHVPNHEITWI